MREEPGLNTQNEAPKNLNMIRFQIPAQGNIAHFMIPADNVDRAKHFYHSLLGWKIEPTRNPMDPIKMAAMQYHDINTGAAKEGTMNTGGLYRRHRTESILTFVEVEDIDKVLSKVEMLGGRITMQKEKIRGVGLTAVI